MTHQEILKNTALVEIAHCEAMLAKLEQMLVNTTTPGQRMTDLVADITAYQERLKHAIMSASYHGYI